LHLRVVAVDEARKAQLIGCTEPEERAARALEEVSRSVEREHERLQGVDAVHIPSAVRRAGAPDAHRAPPIIPVGHRSTDIDRHRSTALRADHRARSNNAAQSNNLLSTSNHPNPLPRKHPRRNSPRSTVLLRRPQLLEWPAIFSRTHNSDSLAPS